MAPRGRGAGQRDYNVFENAAIMVAGERTSNLGTQDAASLAARTAAFYKETLPEIVKQFPPETLPNISWSDAVGGTAVASHFTVEHSVDMRTSAGASNLWLRRGNLRTKMRWCSAGLNSWYQALQGRKVPTGGPALDLALEHVAEYYFKKLLEEAENKHARKEAGAGEGGDDGVDDGDMVNAEVEEGDGDTPACATPAQANTSGANASPAEAALTDPESPPEETSLAVVPTSAAAQPLAIALPLTIEEVSSAFWSARGKGKGKGRGRGRGRGRALPSKMQKPDSSEAWKVWYRKDPIFMAWVMVGPLGKKLPSLAIPIVPPAPPPDIEDATPPVAVHQPHRNREAQKEAMKQSHKMLGTPDSRGGGSKGQVKTMALARLVKEQQYASALAAWNSDRDDLISWLQFNPDEDEKQAIKRKFTELTQRKPQPPPTEEAYANLGVPQGAAPAAVGAGPSASENVSAVDAEPSASETVSAEGMGEQTTLQEGASGEKHGGLRERGG